MCKCFRLVEWHQIVYTVLNRNLLLNTQKMVRLDFQVLFREKRLSPSNPNLPYFALASLRCRFGGGGVVVSLNIPRSHLGMILPRHQLGRLQHCPNTQLNVAHLLL